MLSLHVSTVPGASKRQPQTSTSVTLILSYPNSPKPVPSHLQASSSSSLSLSLSPSQHHFASPIRKLDLQSLVTTHQFPLCPLSLSTPLSHSRPYFTPRATSHIGPASASTTPTTLVLLFGAGHTFGLRCQHIHSSGPRKTSHSRRAENSQSQCRAPADSAGVDARLFFPQDLAVITFLPHNHAAPLITSSFSLAGRAAMCPGNPSYTQ